MRPGLLFTLLVLSTATLAAERSIAKASIDGAPLELSQPSGTKLRLVVGSAAPMPLETPGWGDGPEQDSLRKDQPLTVGTFALPNGATGAWVDFGLEDGAGGVRAVTVLLVRPSASAAWNVAHEWFADSIAIGEMGFRRERQSFAVADGRITRTLRSYAVEGVTHQLDCGCTACSSRATDIEENEVLLWNAATHTFELQKHDKWYMAQAGENLLAAVRKALGDARRVNRVAKLNPQILDGTTFKGGERVLVANEVKN